MKWVPFFVAAVLVSFLIGAAPSTQKDDSSAIRLGDLSISKTGVLSINGQASRYLLVPEDKYPAELRGIALVDLNAGIYVARFFEPGGVGVEGFFDICFQVKGRHVTTALVKNAGSLERIAGATYARSCSYVFDAEKGVLLKTAFAETKPAETSLAKHLKPFTPK
ncbi:MAG TPA: hypothetical protein VJA21_33300 [Verrucomicrobiae bacterium]